MVRKWIFGALVALAPQVVAAATITHTVSLVDDMPDNHAEIWVPEYGWDQDVYVADAPYYSEIRLEPFNSALGTLEGVTISYTLHAFTDADEAGYELDFSLYRSTEEGSSGGISFPGVDLGAALDAPSSSGPHVHEVPESLLWLFLSDDLPPSDPIDEGEEGGLFAFIGGDGYAIFQDRAGWFGAIGFGADIELTYTYAPAPAPVPLPAAGGLGLAGMLALGALRLCRRGGRAV